MSVEEDLKYLNERADGAESLLLEIIREQRSGDVLMTLALTEDFIERVKSHLMYYY